MSEKSFRLECLKKRIKRGCKEDEKRMKRGRKEDEKNEQAKNVKAG